MSTACVCTVCRDHMGGWVDVTNNKWVDAGCKCSPDNCVGSARLAYEAYRNVLDHNSPNAELGGWNKLSQQEKSAWNAVVKSCTDRYKALIKQATGYNTGTCPWCSNRDKDDPTVRKPQHAKDCSAFTPNGHVR